MAGIWTLELRLARSAPNRVNWLRRFDLTLRFVVDFWLVPSDTSVHTDSAPSDCLDAVDRDRSAFDSIGMSMVSATTTLSWGKGVSVRSYK
eukprot:scaffold71_cov247-Pinguiococcus_pyrenoidosus.AAC.12